MEDMGAWDRKRGKVAEKLILHKTCKGHREKNAIDLSHTIVSAPSE